jgi:hypothetical protein
VGHVTSWVFIEFKNYLAKSIIYKFEKSFKKYYPAVRMGLSKGIII